MSVGDGQPSLGGIKPAPRIVVWSREERQQELKVKELMVLHWCSLAKAMLRCAVERDVCSWCRGAPQGVFERFGCTEIGHCS